MKQWQIHVSVLSLVLTVVMSGCATQRPLLHGRTAMADHHWDDAVIWLEQARKKEPDNIEIQILLNRARAQLAASLADAGWQLLQAGDLPGARTRFEQALSYDMANALAQDGVRRIEGRTFGEEQYSSGLDFERNGRYTAAARAYREALRVWPDHPSAGERLQQINQKQYSREINENAALLNQKVSFSFENASLRDIFRALGSASEVNILLDESLVLPESVTLELREVRLGEAIDDLAKTYSLATVHLQENTVLLIPDTPDQRQRFAKESVELFVLKYADAQSVKDLLTPVLKTSVVLADERMNAVIVRTDSDQIGIARELVESVDMRESEVIIQLEFLEVSKNAVKDLGMSLGDDPSVRLSMGGGIKPSGSDGRLSLRELEHIGGANFFLTLPSLYLDLLKRDSHSRLLAKPRLRIINRTPAKLHIGEKVPIKMSTSRYRNSTEETATYEYRDVGILLEMTPKIISGSELSLDLRLEVSSILSENQEGQPTLGTREVTTTLRLRNGETEIIAGLIRDEDRIGRSEIPMFADIPLVGRLFGNDAADSSQTDIVIALTPHLLDRRMDDRMSTTLWLGDVQDQQSGSYRGYRTARKTGDTAPFGPAGSPPLPEDVETGTETGTGASGTGENDEPGEPDDSLAQVYILPDTARVAPDGTVTVTVEIENAVNVASVPFHLEYDNMVVEALDVREGSFLSASGRSTTFLSSIDNEKGRIIIGLTLLGADSGVEGSGTLVEIDFKGIKEGTSPLKFSHESVRDPLAGTLRSRFTGGSIDVKLN